MLLSYIREEAYMLDLLNSKLLLERFTARMSDGLMRRTIVDPRIRHKHRHTSELAYSHPTKRHPP